MEHWKVSVELNQDQMDYGRLNQEQLEWLELMGVWGMEHWDVSVELKQDELE